MKTVNIYEYAAVLKELVASGREVNMLVSGGSMAPFLADKRDTIIISPPGPVLKRGDMVFYQRKNGQYIMHRIHHIDRNGYLHIVGDAQSEIEAPVMPEQVWGVVRKVIRKGKMIDHHDFWWFFFAKIWIRIVPLRRWLVRVYELWYKGRNDHGNAE